MQPTSDLIKLPAHRDPAPVNLLTRRNVPEAVTINVSRHESDITRVYTHADYLAEKAAGVVGPNWDEIPDIELLVECDYDSGEGFYIADDYGIVKEMIVTDGGTVIAKGTRLKLTDAEIEKAQEEAFQSRIAAIEAFRYPDL
jgi:hypothetical protein